MEKLILDNGIKLLYEYRKGNISSFSIGFDAGAIREEGFNLGVAHALEHLLFKGTYNKNEEEINKLCDELFGFNNAMTNYPYAIYYGTCSSNNFYKAFELYSDIATKPSLKEEGFKEEINVILQECKEWKEDFDQYCEDELFYNSFNHRRIKHTIIGNENSIKSIDLEEVKSFYKSFYTPENCAISVVTSLDKQEVYSIVNKLMGNFRKEECLSSAPEEVSYEKNINGSFSKKLEGLEGVKIQYCFDISFLSEEEIETLYLFNMIFGEGVSSLLYDEIRTKNGLAYDVYSLVKNEKGIKLFTINASISKENIDRTLSIIDGCLLKVIDSDFFKAINLKNYERRLKLKRELSIEKSIELAKKLCTYEIMYGDGHKVYKEISENENIGYENINEVLIKVFQNKTVQILL